MIVELSQQHAAATSSMHAAATSNKQQAAAACSSVTDRRTDHSNGDTQEIGSHIYHTRSDATKPSSILFQPAPTASLLDCL